MPNALPMFFGKVLKHLHVDVEALGERFGESGFPPSGVGSHSPSPPCAGASTAWKSVSEAVAKSE
eukprot:3289327-Amphidinium_carterae.1